MRHATVKELECLANQPSFKKHLGVHPGSYADFSNYYSRPKNLAFICSEGAMLFAHAGDDVYETHFLFWPRGGARIMRAARRMLAEMFTVYGAAAIRGCPPYGHRTVRAIGVALGFKKIPGKIVTDTVGRECEVYEIGAKEWAALSEGSSEQVPAS